MSPLSSEQVEAVRQLEGFCNSLGKEVVIIGAVAYRIWIDDKFRHTEDVDAAVAIDLDDLPRLATLLREEGWKQDDRREHRWHTPQGVRLDLIPAGPALRRQHYLEWPASGMRMSLLGFEHVFADAVEYAIAPNLSVKVISLPVLALLKIVAYLDNPYEREKDVEDLTTLLTRYEPDDAARFSDEVLDAGLSYETAGPFLIGKALGALCSNEEAALVENFLSQVNQEESRSFHIFARTLTTATDEASASRAHALIEALTHGFRSDR